MGWARIDDTFADNRKIMGLPLEAVGLWTLTLTWAHRHTVGTDHQGCVPLHLAARFAGTKAKRCAAALVAAGLWEVCEAGWTIHDFDQYLPTAKTREERSKAGAKGAAKRWQRNGKVPSGSEANGIANDGSRAGAPVGTTPVGTTGLRPYVPPVPVPTTSGSRTTANAGKIIAEHIDACSRRPPDNVVGQLAKQVGNLLTEGIDPEFIREGLARFRERDVHPSVLPSLVNGVMNPPKKAVKVGGNLVPDDEEAWL